MALDRWSSYAVTIVWELGWADSALGILDERSSYRGGCLNRFNCSYFSYCYYAILHFFLKFCDLHSRCFSCEAIVYLQHCQLLGDLEIWEVSSGGISVLSRFKNGGENWGRERWGWGSSLGSLSCLNTQCHTKELKDP